MERLNLSEVSLYLKKGASVALFIRLAPAIVIAQVSNTTLPCRQRDAGVSFSIQ
jgi:hypothetical protein